MEQLNNDTDIILLLIDTLKGEQLVSGCVRGCPSHLSDPVKNHNLRCQSVKDVLESCIPRAASNILEQMGMVIVVDDTLEEDNVCEKDCMSGYICFMADEKQQLIDLGIEFKGDPSESVTGLITESCSVTKEVHNKLDLLWGQFIWNLD